jgi:secondary thiamine-phosphate synthase enzyme
MKLFREEIVITTSKVYDFIDLTEKIEKIVEKSKIKNGILTVNSLHNTAALIIQENDPSIFEDLRSSLEKFFPSNAKYAHSYEGNINATAHLKNSLLGSSVSVPIENGKLRLGTWQRIIFVELFEQRNRKVIITIIGE